MFESEVAVGLGLVAERVAAVSRDAVDAVVAWEQVISWAQAQQVVATAAVADEAPGWITTERGRAGLSDVQVAGAELAPALRLARMTAQRRVYFATRVVDRLPGSVAALAAGSITMPKLMAIEEATAVLSAELARRVETMVLPIAPDLTPGDLRRVLATTVIRVDPAAAEKRRKAAVGARKVTTVPLPDGVAGLWAVMEASKTVSAYTVIDTLARLAKTPDDDRGMDALRSDALFDLIADAHDRLTGNAPSPAFPGEAAAGGTAMPGTDRDGDGASGSEGDPDAAAGLARSARDTATGRRPATGTGRRPRRSPRLYSVQVTVPAETLTGQSEEPGQLATYGPVTAQAARELAAQDATWQRILVDPATGTLLDLGTTVYAPPDSLAQFVLARDRTCRHPGCRQPAARCDLDHCTRFPDGPTAHWNLAPSCRFHHRLKHHTKWRPVMDSAGVITWTSATGRVHLTHPWDYRGGTWLDEPPADQITEADIDSTAEADPPASGPRPR